MSSDSETTHGYNPIPRIGIISLLWAARQVKQVLSLEDTSDMANLAGESEVLPKSAAAEILPQCQVVILSATTLLNRPLDDLLACCRNPREVAVVGPSTPLLPAVFAERGVTLLSGVQVVNGERVLRLVSEGGGTRQLGSAVRKLTVRCGAY